MVVPMDSSLWPNLCRQLRAPVLAGILLTTIGIAGVMTIDIVTFVVAILSILASYDPPTREFDGRSGTRVAPSGARLALAFATSGHGKACLAFRLTFTISNFFAAIGIVLIAPMILARTGNNELILGTVQSMTGVGGLVGGLSPDALGRTQAPDSWGAARLYRHQFAWYDAHRDRPDAGHLVNCGFLS